LNRRIILQLEDIHARYTNIDALNGIDFNLFEGEVHGLYGEHGAGKSTLAKVISGAISRVSGNYYLEGKKNEKMTIRNAIKNGIIMVYQDTLNITPHMTVRDNIFMRNFYQVNYFGKKYTEFDKKLTSFFQKYSIAFDTSKYASTLSIQEQYFIDVISVLVNTPKIVIFDEISNRLQHDEFQIISRIMLDLKKSGTSFIFITHNMDEILAFSDRITILRNGLRIATEKTDDLDKSKLFQLSFSAVYKQSTLTKSNATESFIFETLQNVTNHLSEGLIIFDENFSLKLINFSAIEIFGINDTFGYNNILSIIKEKLPEYSDSIIEKILNRNPFEVHEVFSNAKRLSIRCIPIDLFTQNSTYFCLIVEDLTMKFQIQGYLLDAEKMTSVAEIAAGIAHEINNPLFIIKNYIELIAFNLRDKEPLGYIEKINNEINRIMKICSGILSFSKIRKTEKIRANICDLVDEALLLLDYQIKSKDIKVIKTYFDTDLNILCDETALTLCFVNIIKNSVEAVLDNGQIEISVALVGENMAIEITDNGYGISSENLARRFSPFFSTKVGKKNAGIGLSISKNIIESLNGSIEAFMTLDSKTCFRILLPAERCGQ
jgi:two-component system sensor histidine kinase AtoS